MRRALIVTLLMTACSRGSDSPPVGVVSSQPSPDTAASAVVVPQMRAPESFAIDPKGQLVYSDCEAQRIFRLTQAGRVEVLAGSGPGGFEQGGFRGDGGPAVAARLNCPSGLAYDANGNLFVADSINNRVRMIDPEGIITTVAGAGPPGLDRGGYVGDGGPATEARLEFPVGLAIDGTSNLYIADHGNDAIRKVDPAGTITTFAGTGIEGYSGDGGPSAKAQLHGPFSLAFDRLGDLFVTERENAIVRKIDPRGRISTVDASSFVEPYGLAVDGSGNLFVSDDLANVIKEIPTDGRVRTVAGVGTAGSSGDGGPAVEAELDSPFGLLVGGIGTLFIADGGNGCVRAIDDRGTITSVTCG
jgi:sugar lactone lactonase YvrE